MDPRFQAEELPVLTRELRRRFANRRTACKTAWQGLGAGTTMFCSFGKESISLSCGSSPKIAQRGSVSGILKFPVDGTRCHLPSKGDEMSLSDVLTIACCRREYAAPVSARVGRTAQLLHLPLGRLAFAPSLSKLLSKGPKDSRFFELDSNSLMKKCVQHIMGSVNCC